MTKKLELVQASAYWYATPESVDCPAAGCRAPAGEPCRAPRTHSARTSRAVSRDLEDERRAHDRAWRALDRVREAVAGGYTPEAGDVTQALGSCGCHDCKKDTVVLAQELAPWM